MLYVLLLFAGVNVPLDRLPDWLSTLAQGLPITHGAEAARDIVGGASFTHVAPLIGAEAVVGLTYTVVGLATLRLFEHEARRGATLELPEPRMSRAGRGSPSGCGRRPPVCLLIRLKSGANITI